MSRTVITRQLEIWRRAFGRGVYPHQLRWLLDLPGRGLILSADTLAARLPLRPDAMVLEVGSGSGYYSAAVAQRVPAGQLTLLDVQPQMLTACADKLCQLGISNFRTQQADAKSLPFEDDSFDVIFMVTVFGEIEDRASFLAEAYRVLKADGVLSITEHHPDPDFEPAPVVAATLKGYGLLPLQKLGCRWAYTMNAVKAR